MYRIKSTPFFPIFHNPIGTRWLILSSIFNGVYIPNLNGQDLFSNHFYFRVSETPDCKMTKSSLARVFGPIIIRHSRPDRELEFSLKEVKKQHLVSFILLFYY